MDYCEHKKMTNVPLLKKNTGIFVLGISRLENVEQMERCILSASCKGLKFCISDANQKKTMELCKKNYDMTGGT